MTYPKVTETSGISGVALDLLRSALDEVRWDHIAQNKIIATAEV